MRVCTNPSNKILFERNGAAEGGEVGIRASYKPIFLLWALLCLVSSTELVGLLGYVGLSEITAWTRIACTSTEELLTVSWIMRKVSHIVLFGVLGLLAESSARPGTRWMTLAVGLSVCLLAEFMQNYATGRSAEWRDAVINLTAFVVGAYVPRLRRRPLFR